MWPVECHAVCIRNVTATRLRRGTTAGRTAASSVLMSEECSQQARMTRRAADRSRCTADRSRCTADRCGCAITGLSAAEQAGFCRVRHHGSRGTQHGQQSKELLHSSGFPKRRVTFFACGSSQHGKVFRQYSRSVVSANLLLVDRVQVGDTKRTCCRFERFVAKKQRCRNATVRCNRSRLWGMPPTVSCPSCRCSGTEIFRY